MYMSCVDVFMLVWAGVMYRLTIVSVFVLFKCMFMDWCSM